MHPAIDGPSIAIVTDGKGGVEWGDGEGLDISEGDVFFVGAGTEMKMVAKGEANGQLVIHRAFVEA
ncbi:hypothetical protein A0H81_02259 [Grifola frondosa]|uniref:Cupin 2 conserved barrel domain-containing protein n=1 Tax=Grifola frondosa TaxID=5627 RepID=A0A1C7MLE3_GRIFR|nr:hypothetical protein A0H81_02259 [Grifola frondosa]